MAKIGVLTFFGTTDNYGQVLQYLATQEYLNSLGHSTSLIVPKGYERTFWRRVKWKLQYYYTKITSFLHKSKKTVSLRLYYGNEKYAVVGVDSIEKLKEIAVEYQQAVVSNYSR